MGSKPIAPAAKAATATPLTFPRNFRRLPKDGGAERADKSFGLSTLVWSGAFLSTPWSRFLSISPSFFLSVDSIWTIAPTACRSANVGVLGHSLIELDSFAGEVTAARRSSQLDQGTGFGGR